MDFVIPIVPIDLPGIGALSQTIFFDAIELIRTISQIINF